MSIEASTKPGRSSLRQIVTLLAVLAAFGVNALSNVVPLNGLTIGEISNTEFSDVLIIPANYAFAIWGLIYLALFAFAGYQVRPAHRENPRLQRGGYLLAIACLLQIVWVFIFLNRLFVLSAVAMAGILLALIGYYVRLGIGRETPSRGDRWFVNAPISIYLGWISVATVVNVASALSSVGWLGWGLSAAVWTNALIVITTAIALAVAFRRGDQPYVLVIIWALVAIAVRPATPASVDIMAIGTSVVLAIVAVVSGMGDRPELPSQP